MSLAPGITISQAVVKIEGDDARKEDINKLENRLKTQRNRAIRQHGLGWMISERSRSTGNTGVAWGKDGKVVDLAQVVKQNASDSSRDKLMEKLVKDYRRGKKYYPFEMEHLVEGKTNGWIAVVHADGNSLGKLIQEMIPKLEEKGDAKSGFSEFSKQLNEATVQAANDAFIKVVKEDYENRILQDQNTKERLFN